MAEGTQVFDEAALQKQVSQSWLPIRAVYPLVQFYNRGYRSFENTGNMVEPLVPEHLNNKQVWVQEVKDGKVWVKEIKNGRVQLNHNDVPEPWTNQWTDVKSGMRMLSALQMFLRTEYLDNDEKSIHDFFTLSVACIRLFKVGFMIEEMHRPYPEDYEDENGMHRAWTGDKKTNEVVLKMFEKRRQYMKNVLQCGLGICWWGYLQKGTTGPTEQGFEYWALRATAAEKAEQVRIRIKRKESPVNKVNGTIVIVRVMLSPNERKKRKVLVYRTHPPC